MRLISFPLKVLKCKHSLVKVPLLNNTGTNRGTLGQRVHPMNLNFLSKKTLRGSVRMQLPLNILPKHLTVIPNLTGQM